MNGIRTSNLHIKDSLQEIKLDMSLSSRKRILLVEDEPLILMAEKQMIRNLQCDADAATNGEIALKLLSEKNRMLDTKYDLIFMDINMPVMNGYITSSRINELVAKGDILGTPIVCLSAQESSEHMKRCHDVGITDFGKPSFYQY